MEKLTVPQLKDELIRMNLSTTGTKPELIGRIRASVRGITIWNSPILICHYFLLYFISSFKKSFLNVKSSVILLAGVACWFLWVLFRTQESHQMFASQLEGSILWFSWWVGLGIASSIGLGTGLHTFVLFLGPYLARSTLTAYSCHNLDFDTRGVNAFVCSPSSHDISLDQDISPWHIFQKVFLEILFWGTGTAIGELPPFFVAKAAALAGQDDPEFNSIETILKKRPNKRSLYERTQVVMHSMVKSLGFWGILILASIPNPLFDLAGVMCGHFGVKFATFFLATFIGKALVKCNVQSFAIILLFSKNTISWFKENMVEQYPLLQRLIGGMLDNLQEFGDLTPKTQKESKGSVLAAIWSLFMIGMILYFILSTIESLALSHLRETNIKRRKQE